MTNEPRLTEKQVKLVEGILAGKSQTQAAIDAGAPESSAAVYASQTLRSPKVASVLEKAGLTSQHLASRLRFAVDDDDPKVRPSMVRAVELGMRASGMLTDTTVSIDARSVVIDGAESLSVAQLEAMAQQLAASSQAGDDDDERAETG